MRGQWGLCPATDPSGRVSGCSRSSWPPLPSGAPVKSTTSLFPSIPPSSPPPECHSLSVMHDISATWLEYETSHTEQQGTDDDATFAPTMWSSVCTCAHVC